MFLKLSLAVSQRALCFCFDAVVSAVETAKLQFRAKQSDPDKATVLDMHVDQLAQLTSSRIAESRWQLHTVTSKLAALRTTLSDSSRAGKLSTQLINLLSTLQRLEAAAAEQQDKSETLNRRVSKLRSSSSSAARSEAIDEQTSVSKFMSPGKAAALRRGQATASASPSRSPAQTNNRSRLTDSVVSRSSALRGTPSRSVSASVGRSVDGWGGAETNSSLAVTGMRGYQPQSPSPSPQEDDQERALEDGIRAMQVGESPSQRPAQTLASGHNVSVEAKARVAAILASVSKSKDSLPNARTLPRSRAPLEFAAYRASPGAESASDTPAVTTTEAKPQALGISTLRFESPKMVPPPSVVAAAEPGKPHAAPQPATGVKPDAKVTVGLFGSPGGSFSATNDFKTAAPSTKPISLSTGDNMFAAFKSATLPDASLPAKEKAAAFLDPPEKTTTESVPKLKPSFPSFSDTSEPKKDLFAAFAFATAGSDSQHKPDPIKVLPTGATVTPVASLEAKTALATPGQSDGVNPFQDARDRITRLLTAVAPKLKAAMEAEILFAQHGDNVWPLLIKKYGKDAVRPYIPAFHVALVADGDNATTTVASPPGSKATGTSIPTEAAAAVTPAVSQPSLGSTPALPAAAPVFPGTGAQSLFQTQTQSPPPVAVSTAAAATTIGAASAGVPAPSSGTSATAVTSRPDALERLKEFYAKHAPDNLPKAEANLKKFEGTIWARLSQKYGADKVNPFMEGLTLPATAPATSAPPAFGVSTNPAQNAFGSFGGIANTFANPSQQQTAPTTVATAQLPAFPAAQTQPSGLPAFGNVGQAPAGSGSLPGAFGSSAAQSVPQTFGFPAPSSSVATANQQQQQMPGTTNAFGLQSPPAFGGMSLPAPTQPAFGSTANVGAGSSTFGGIGTGAPSFGTPSVQSNMSGRPAVADSVHKERLAAFYNQFGPDHLSKLEANYQKYGKGIWNALAKKYGADKVNPFIQDLDVPPPTQPSAAAAGPAAAPVQNTFGATGFGGMSLGAPSSFGSIAANPAMGVTPQGWGGQQSFQQPQLQSQLGSGAPIGGGPQGFGTSFGQAAPSQTNNVFGQQQQQAAPPSIGNLTFGGGATFGGGLSFGGGGSSNWASGSDSECCAAGKLLYTCTTIDDHRTGNYVDLGAVSAAAARARARSILRRNRDR
jgi:hypothetical protein